MEGERGAAGGCVAVLVTAAVAVVVVLLMGEGKGEGEGGGQRSRPLLLVMIVVEPAACRHQGALALLLPAVLLPRRRWQGSVGTVGDATGGALALAAVGTAGDEGGRRRGCWWLRCCWDG